ncbi:MAG: putative Ig domain-containing protein [Bacillota bacterium]
MIPCPYTFYEMGGSAEGKASVDHSTNGSVLLKEGDSFLAALSREVVIPESGSGGSAYLEVLSYSDLLFPSQTPDMIHDAFEVALVDDQGRSLVPTIGPNHDAFLNITEGVDEVAKADGVDVTTGVVKVNVSHLTPGITAYLRVRLVNNDGDADSSVRVYYTLDETTGGSTGSTTTTTGPAAPASTTAITSGDSNQVSTESGSAIVSVPASGAVSSEASTGLGTSYVPGATSSQAVPSSKGTEFWVAFPWCKQLYGPYTRNDRPPTTMYDLRITADHPASGVVDIPDLGWKMSFTVTPDSPATIKLPSEVAKNVIDSSTRVSINQYRGAVHVVATDKVSVYGMYNERYDQEAYLALPVEALGTDYVALGYKCLAGNNPATLSDGTVVAIDDGTFFAIVATADDTIVEITLPDGTQIPDVSLGAGEVYQYIDRKSNADLSGTIIHSKNHPIAVYAGARGGYVLSTNAPPASESVRDYMVEQMPPISTWGKEFYAYPRRDINPAATGTDNNSRKDVYRIIASFPAGATSVVNVRVIEGTTEDSYPLTKANPVWTYITAPSQPVHIIADKSVLVAQYSVTSGYVEEQEEKTGLLNEQKRPSGDPFMMLIPPVEQYCTAYSLDVPRLSQEIPLTIPMSEYFITIVAPFAAVDQVLLDGRCIAASEFQQIGGSGYYGARLKMDCPDRYDWSPITHTLTSPQPFMAWAHAYGTDEAYGFPAGMSLARIGDVTNVTLLPSGATRGIDATDAAHPVCATHLAQAVVTHEDPITQTQTPISGVTVYFEVTRDGNKITSGWGVTDAFGRASFSYVGAQLGTDTITARVGRPADTPAKTSPEDMVAPSMWPLQATTTVQWIPATAPEITNLSPGQGTVLPVGRSIVFAGHVGASQPIVSVTVNGVPVESLDAFGNFFTTLPITEGTNPVSVVATDALGLTATATLTLKGQTPQAIDFDRIDSLSPEYVVEYERTSFDEREKVLFVDVKIANNHAETESQWALRSPLLLGIRNISDPSVTVWNADGATPEGIPFFDLTSGMPADGQLAPGGSTEPVTMSFHNPNGRPFTYEMVLLGQVNRAPVFVNSPVVETYAGENYRSEVKAEDLDGDTITYSLVAAPPWLGISDDGTIGIVAKQSSVAGDYTVTVRAKDRREAACEMTYVLSVFAPPPVVNRPPVFESMPVAVAEVNREYVYRVVAGDADYDPLDPNKESLTFEVPIGMALAEVADQPNTKLLKWIPTAADRRDNGGNRYVELRVHDKSGAVATQVFTISIQPEAGNHAPVIVTQPSTGWVSDPGGGQWGWPGPLYASYCYNVDAVDADGDTLSYSLTQTYSDLTINASTGVLCWTPTVEAARRSVVIRVEDGRGGIDTQTITLSTATAGGHPRLLPTYELISGLLPTYDLSGTVETKQGAATSGQPGWAVFLDDNNNGSPDVNSITVSGAVFDSVAKATIPLPSEGTAIPDNGTLTVVFPVRNLTGWLFDAKLNVTVTHSAPGELKAYLYDPSGWCEPISYVPTGTGQDVTFTLNGLPNEWRNHAANGVSEELPNHEWRLEIQDEAAGNVGTLRACSLTVTAADFSTLTDAGGSFTFWKLEQGTTYHIIQERRPGYEQISPSTGAALEVSSAPQTGDPALRFVNQKLTATANDPPMIWEGMLQDGTLQQPALVGATWFYHVFATDADADALTYELPIGPEGMAINEATGVIAWRPRADQAGIQSFTVRVRDGKGGIAVKTFNVKTNRAPIITTQPSSTYAIIDANSSQPYTYQINAFDPDGDTLAYRVLEDVVEGNGDGIDVNSVSGLITWTPSVGIKTVTVVVEDKYGAADTQALSLVGREGNRQTLPSISGKVYRDDDDDNTQDENEPGLAGWSLFLDLNQNGCWDSANEPTATTQDGEHCGEYSFESLSPGEYHIVAVPSAPGFVRSTGVTRQDLIVRVDDVPIASGDSTSFGYHSMAQDARPPVFRSSPPTRVTVGQTLRYQASAVYYQGNALNYDLLMAPPGMMIAMPPGTGAGQTAPAWSEGLLLWEPTIDQVGTYEVTLRVRDESGSEALQEFQVTVEPPVLAPPVAGNVSPEIVSKPRLVAELNQPYTYVVRVQDPDGLRSRYYLQSGPHDMVLDPEMGVLTWKPTAAGSKSVAIRVEDDRGGYAVQEFTIQAVDSNRAPIVTSTPVTRVAAGSVYTYAVKTFDPEGANVTYTLVANDASGMQIDSKEVITWQSPVARSGTYAIEVQVSDGTAVTHQYYNLTVFNDRPPQILVDKTQTVTDGQVYEYRFRIYDPDGDAIQSVQVTSTPEMTGPDSKANSLKVSGVDGNGYVTVSWDMGGHTDITCSKAYVLTICARDQWWSEAEDQANAKASETYTLEVVPDTEKPVVEAGASPLSSDKVFVRVDARDNARVEHLGFIFKNGKDDSGTSYEIDEASDCVVSVSGNPDGWVGVTGWAYDSTEYDTSHRSESSIVWIQIGSGSMGESGLTAKITKAGETDSITDPVMVEGQAGGLPGVPTTYELRLESIDGTQVTTLKQGNATVASEGDLVAIDPAKIDPTLLRNGTYKLCLVVTDGTHTQTDSRIIHLESELKLGNFNLSFTDMQVSVGGMPIDITRTYDTLDAQQSNDLGYGWSLNFNLQVQESPETRILYPLDLMDEAMYRYKLGPDDCLSVRAGGSRDVWLTLPDGRRVRFDFEIAPDGNRYTAGFKSPPGVGAQLLIMGETEIVRSSLGDNIQYWRSLKPDGLYQALSDLTPLYDIPGYILKLEDGTEFYLEKTEYLETRNYGRYIDLDGEPNNQIRAYIPHVYHADPHLTKIVTPDGVTLEVTPEGIFNSGKSLVAVRRDALGRIDQITDLSQNSVTYRYDENGDLTSVTDRANQTTTFTYGQADPTRHYLMGITDARGVQVMTTTFENGQLKQINSSANNPIEVGHDTSSRTETVTGAMGEETLCQYDPMGHVVRRAERVSDSNTPNNRSDDSYLLTFYTYNGKGKQTGESRPVKVSYAEWLTQSDPSPSDPSLWQSSSTYDANGYLESVTDAAGKITYYGEYDSFGNAGTITDPLGNTTRYSYVNGRLRELRSPAGEVTRYYYDARANLTDIIQVDASGHEIRVSHIAFDEAGRVTSTTDAAGLTRQYRYDADGNQTLVYYLWVDPNDENNTKTIVTRTDYDPEGRVTGTRQYALTGPQEFGADSDSDLDDETPLWSESTHYNAVGQVDSSTDRWGAETVTRYDLRGNVVETRRKSKDENGTPCWVVTRMAYDASGRLIAETDPFIEGVTSSANIRITYTLYDSLGRVHQIQRLAGWHITIDQESGSAGIYKSTFGPNDNEEHRVLSSTATEYDDEGRVRYTISAEGLTTCYEYDATGRATAVVYAMDLNHNGTVEATDTPDSQGKTDGIPDSGSELIRTSYTFDDAGRQTGVTDALQHDTQSELDEMGRTTKSIFNDGSSTETIFDKLGRRVAEIDPLGRRTDYEYDDAGRLTAVVLPAINPADPTSPRPRYEYGYDQYGNRTSLSDNIAVVSDVVNRDDARLTTYTFDFLGRQLSRTLPLGQTPGSGFAEQMFYDDSTRASLTNPQASAGLGQLAYSVDFEGHVTQYLYDNTPEGGGRLAEKRYYVSEPAFAAKTVAECVTYTYDAFGRTLQVVQDRNGNINTTDDQNVTTYAYDAEGRQTQVSTSHGGNSYTVRYEYNGLGQMVRTYTGNEDPADTSMANDGKAVTDTRYTYDPLGRLETVSVRERQDTPLTTPETTTYQYDKVGNLDLVKQSNGVFSHYDYDDLNRLELETIRNAAGNPIFEQDYTLRADGQRERVIEKRYDGVSATPFSTVRIDWTYGALNRLTGETRDEGNDGIQNAGDYTDAYAFDLVGNRIRKVHDAVGTANDETITYTYNADDELMAEDSTVNANDKTYIYDANGSTTGVTTSSGTKRYVWDLRNQMVGYDANGDGDTSDPGDATYTYNSDGIRTSEQVVSEEAKFYLIDDHNPTGYAKPLEQSATPGGMPTLTYVLGLDVIGQSDGTAEGTLYLLKDGHGTTRALVDSSGNGVERYDFDAYGNKVRYTDANGDPLVGDPMTVWLMADGYRDFATHLDRNGVRDVAGYIGRMWSRDPWDGNDADPLTLHTYLYASANPIYSIDPSGHMAISITETQAAIGIGLLMTGILLPKLAPALRAQTFVSAWTQAKNLVDDLVISGENTAMKAAAVLMANTAVVTTAISTAMSKATRLTNQLRNLKIYPVIRSMGPDVYANDVAALASNPAWYTLKYNGPGNPVTAKKRAAAVRAYTGPAPKWYESLDEFPYASTAQGGAGSRVMAVPAAQNAVQGGLLSAFYRLSLMSPTLNPSGNMNFLVVPIPL